ncbi:MAG: hypothetical protein CMO01_08615 [Thalassobius sp.]|nr:hypothetical protein [Thalassovita sp.]
MIWNYLKIIKRNLFKNSFISFINIFGLAIGIAASLLVFMHVTHEFSYDGFHANADEIYKAESEFEFAGETRKAFGFSADFGTDVQQTIPGITNFIRLNSDQKVKISDKKNVVFYENNFTFTDNNFLDFFSFRIISGDVNTALSKPNTVWLTEKTAQKYFGNKNPIGEILYYDSEYTFEVVGVLENPPSNTSIQFDFLAPISSFASMSEKLKARYNNEKISLGSFHTFFQIDESVNLDEIENKISPKVRNEQIKDINIQLKPIQDFYLETHPKTKLYLLAYLLSGIAIIFLAIMNYANLVTAQASTRAKETGVRKVMGAKRATLIFQFLFESIIFNSIAFAIGFLLLHLSISGFIDGFNIKMNEDFILSNQFLITTSCLFLFCILAGSIYPSIVLSRFSPNNILKSNTGKYSTGSTVRKSITILQFSASTILICFSIAIQSQVNLLQNQDTGLDREQVMVVDIPASIGSKYADLKNTLNSYHEISTIGTSTGLSVYKNSPSTILYSSPTTGEKIPLHLIGIDTDFLKTLDIEWKTPPVAPLSNYSIILNETALKQMSLSDSSMGQPLSGVGGILSAVLKDFTYSTDRNPIEALGILVQESESPNLTANGATMYIKIKKDATLAKLLAEIEQKYQTFLPDQPFEFYFLDEAFNNLYKDEVQTARMFQFFTLIAIVIAALGLLGLASFAANRRTKEIGIRKVVGASVFNIFYLLSKEYFKLILISFVIAIPVANYFITEWLSGFAYRIEVKWWLYALPALLILTVALFAMGGRIIKAATVNPVDSLRDE